MKSILSLCWAVFLVCSLVSARGRVDEEERRMLQAQIETAKREIHREEASGRQDLGHLWGQLGIMYQAHDIKYHDGGSMKALALDAFQRALSSSDDDKVLYLVNHRMGMLLKMMGRAAEAVEAHERAHRLASNAEEKADTLVQHAAALGMIGDLQGTTKLLQRALRIFPKGIAAYLPLVAAHKEMKDLSKTEWARLVDSMTAALEEISNGNAKKLNLGISPDIYWAMFQALEMVGRHSEAWEYLEIAHAATMSSRETVSSVAMMDEQLSQVQTVFQRSMFPEPSLGHTSRTPVFIIGMMRSGSTLLETMLDAHPQIYGMGEDSFFNSGLNELRDNLVEALKLEDNSATERVLKAYGKSVVDMMVNQSMTDPSNVDKTAGKVRPRRVVDKMLFNYRNIGFIHLIFPNAVILHTVRDPMDTLLSCYLHKFDDSGLDWALDMPRLSRQYVNYLKNMNHFRKVLPGRVFDVSYQALVTSTEKTIRDVIKKIDVKWDDSVLNFHEMNRTVHTHSMGQVRHKVSSSGIGGWRKYAKQLKPMIDLVKPELRRLKKAGALPFSDSLNWDLDVDFNYGNRHPTSTDTLSGEETAESSKRSGGKKPSAPYDNDAPTEKTSRRRRKPKAVPEEVQVTPAGEASVAEEPRRRKKRRKDGKPQRNREPGASSDKPAERLESAERGSRPPKRKRSDSDSTVDRPLRRTRSEAGAGAKDKRELMTVVEKWRLRSPGAMSSALRHQLPFPQKDSTITDVLVIAYGYYMNRDYVNAAAALQEAIRAEPTLKDNAAVNLAMTQILLATNQFSECLPYARKLTEVEPRFSDGYLALSSALGSLNRHEEAVTVLTKGLAAAPGDMNLLVQRGFNYFRLKKYKSAHSDFSAVKVDRNNEAYILSLVGKCEKEFGDSEASIRTLSRSLELDRNQADAHLDMAIVLMETGRVQEALKYVNISLEIDPAVRNTWGYAGLLYQTLGQCKKAVYYLGKTLELDPYDHTSLLLSAMCYQAELDFQSSFKFFDRLLNLKGEFSYEPNVPFHREIAFYRMNLLDTPLLDYNFDTVVDKQMKAGLNKNTDNVFPSIYNHTVGIVARQRAAEDRVKPLRPSEKAQLALEVSAPLRGWIQLDSPGFLPHRRQHRMFGLAVLEMTQQIRQHVKAVQSGEPGLWVSDARSSIVRVAKGGMVRPTDVRKKGHHLFSYRDFFDTAVKWRQLADPFDIVFWLDGYPPKTQMEMVALSTSLYSGLKRNTRYYPYFNMTFEVFRREMRTKYFAGPDPTLTRKDQLPGVEKAQTLGDLFDVTQVPNIMFVVTECESLVKPGRKIPGTRVVVSRVPPEGFDISIGSPTEENRFEYFSAEVEAAFEKILSALVKGADTETVVELALDLYFYWANWGPLSRGTAATGYAAVISILLSVGEHVTSRVPHMKQMDWEAILRTRPSEFRDAVRSWLSGREKTALAAEWLDGSPGYKIAGDIFVTSRDVVTALSAPDKEDF